jgi:hypothetical protein
LRFRFVGWLETGKVNVVEDVDGRLIVAVLILGS